MKKIIYLLLFVMVTLSCNKIKGEGSILEKDYNLSSSISKIEVGSAMKLVLSDDVAPGEMRIKTYGNIFEYINIKTEIDEVDIYLDNKRYSGNIDITIYASAAQYNSIEANGASQVSLQGAIPSLSYEIDLSGASQFTMDGSFSNIANLSIDASGASKAIVSGSALQCSIEASGASNIDGTQLMCQELDVELEGASKLTIGVNRLATGELSGASALYYKGTGTFNVETSGSSTIKPL